MQEMARPANPGFVVDWQLAEEGPVVDLSTAESELVLADEVGADVGLGRDR